MDRYEETVTVFSKKYSVFVHAWYRKSGKRMYQAEGWCEQNYITGEATTTLRNALERWKRAAEIASDW